MQDLTHQVPAGERSRAFVAMDEIDEPIPERVALAEPRHLTAEERALLDVLLRHPGSKPELVEQANTVQVEATCSCGCPSVFLAVDDGAPPAVYSDADSPPGAGAVQLRASVGESGGPEVILHVLEGRMGELEIWAGGYGIRPHVDPTELVYDQGHFAPDQ
jgi:hypothetical protein